MTAAATPPLAPADPLDPSIAALTATGAVPTSNSKKSSPTDQLANIQGAQLAAQVANWAAQLEFAKERFRLLELPQAQAQSQLQIDQLAFQKASTAWQQAFQEASISGTYQGVPTVQWLTQQAQLTGTLNGSQTIQGKLTDAQINQMNTAMQIAMKNQDLQERQFGFQQTQWNAEFGLQKAAQDMQYGGYTSTGAPTLQREQIENASAQQYLNLLASLRGPANAFAQARVIGNTPNSIRSIADAWLGKYQIGGTTGSGQNPTPANPYNLMGGTAPVGAPIAGAPTANPMSTPAWSMPAAPGAPAPYVDVGGTVTVPPYTYPPTTAPTGPQPFTATPANDGQPIPGRGLDPSQWNFITQQAVQQWNAAHPGFQANGSQLGYGYVGPVPPAGGNYDFNGVPGRGMDPSQWNPATQQAVAAWNAAHPGFTANGSQIGYVISGAAEGGGNPSATIPNAPTPPATGIPGAPAAQPVPVAAPAPISAVGANESGASTGTAPVTAPPSAHSPDTMAAATATTPAPAPATPALPPYSYPASQAQGAPPMSYYTGTTNAAGETAMYSPPGAAAPAGLYNYTPSASGGYNVSMPGQAADPTQHQMSTSSPASPDDLSTWFSGVLPNQINAENYGNMNTYDQTLGWAALEDNGWDISAAQDLFKKSLPRYGGPSTGSFAPQR